VSWTLDTTISSTTTYTELKCPGTEKVNLQVSNGKVLIGFGEGWVDPGQYQHADEPFLPIVGTVYRDCDRIRVKAASPVPTPAPAVIITAIPGDGGDG
jgi:hypothetical protein